MVKEFVAIDGDDVGPQLRALIVANDIQGASTLSEAIIEYFATLCSILEKNDCKVIFCGGDSILASTRQTALDLCFDNLSTGPCTVSIGIGPTPEYTYLALQLAKARGKNQVVRISNTIAKTIHKWHNREEVSL